MDESFGRISPAGLYKLLCESSDGSATAAESIARAAGYGVSSAPNSVSYSAEEEPEVEKVSETACSVRSRS
jgi:hypothetical protein